MPRDPTTTSVTSRAGSNDWSLSCSCDPGLGDHRRPRSSPQCRRTRLLPVGALGVGRDLEGVATGEQASFGLFRKFGRSGRLADRVADDRVLETGLASDVSGDGPAGENACAGSNVGQLNAQPDDNRPSGCQGAAGWNFDRDGDTGERPDNVDRQHDLVDDQQPVNEDRVTGITTKISVTTTAMQIRLAIRSNWSTGVGPGTSPPACLRGRAVASPADPRWSLVEISEPGWSPAARASGHAPSTAGLSTSTHHCRNVVGLAVSAVRSAASSSPLSLARIISTIPSTNAAPRP